MGDGFQFIDIVFFAMIAAFLVLRLRSVLGRRDGHEGGYLDAFRRRSPRERTDGDGEGDTVVALPDRSQEAAGAAEPPIPEAADGTLPAVLARIKRADAKFSPEEFVAGAKSAFEIILGAFAAGDVATLKSLLSADVYANFLQAIRSRERAGERLENALVSMKEAEIVDASVEGRVANVTVKFVSEQMRVTRDESGEAVEGDPSAVIEVTDFWTFSRDTRSRDPNWHLVATRSLE
jgi:predicted lipid-binding transport protein (Tim44 family)